MSRQRILPALLLALVVLALTTACPPSQSPQQQITTILVQRDQALATTNAQAFLDTLAVDYIYENAAPLTEAERLEHYFASWPRLNCAGHDRIIRIDGDSAQVVQRLRLVAHDRSDRLQLTFEGPERLSLVHRQNRWLVTSSHQDLDAILTLMEMRRRAMQSRDLQMYLMTIDPAYQEGEKDLAKINETMTHQFGFWDAIELDVVNRDITVSDQDNSAVVIQSFFMKAVKGEKLEEFQQKERIVLAKNDQGAWRISGGL